MAICVPLFYNITTYTPAAQIHSQKDCVAATFRLLASITFNKLISDYTHTHTRLMALFPGLPGWAGTRKVKPIWILLKQETVSGSGISWDICKSAPSSRQITTPAPHHYSDAPSRLHVLLAAQPTESKH